MRGRKRPKEQAQGPGPRKAQGSGPRIPWSRTAPLPGRRWQAGFVPKIFVVSSGNEKEFTVIFFSLPELVAQMDEYYFLKVRAEDGGFPENFQKFVMANLTGDKRQDKVKVHLALVDQSRHEYSMNAQLLAKILSPAKTREVSTDIVGVGYRASDGRHDLAKVRYEYDITMFDKDTYRKIKRYSAERQCRLNKANRRKSLDIDCYTSLEEFSHHA